MLENAAKLAHDVAKNVLSSIIKLAPGGHTFRERPPKVIDRNASPAHSSQPIVFFDSILITSFPLEKRRKTEAVLLPPECWGIHGVMA